MAAVADRSRVSAIIRYIWAMVASGSGANRFVVERFILAIQYPARPYRSRLVNSQTGYQGSPDCFSLPFPVRFASCLERRVVSCPSTPETYAVDRGGYLDCSVAEYLLACSTGSPYFLGNHPIRGGLAIFWWD